MKAKVVKSLCSKGPWDSSRQLFWLPCSMLMRTGRRRHIAWLSLPGWFEQFHQQRDWAVFFDIVCLILNRQPGEATRVLQRYHGLVYIYDWVSTMTYIANIRPLFIILLLTVQRFSVSFQLTLVFIHPNVKWKFYANIAVISSKMLNRIVCLML